VTHPDASGTSTAAARLVVAAERLFALRGIDGVSLRQIAAEAGSGNNSAVHYHFGSKEGLIAAIFEHRLPRITSERRLLAARCDPDDLRSRFEAHYLPVLNLAEAPDNHYVSFVEQLQRRARGAGTAADLALPEDGRRSNDELHRDLQRLLPHLDEPLRTMRIADAQVLCVHAAADRELAVAAGADRPPFALFVNSLFDGLTGFLAAPASGGTLQRVQGPVGPGAPDLRLI
jgi:AcrR family transcriptional regulator